MLIPADMIVRKADESYSAVILIPIAKAERIAAELRKRGALVFVDAIPFHAGLGGSALLISRRYPESGTVLVQIIVEGGSDEPFHYVSRPHAV